MMEGLNLNHRHRWVRGPLDWMAWIAAILLSAWSVREAPGIMYAYRHYGRLDSVLMALAFDALVLLFDVVLIVHAVKNRQAATNR